MHEWFAHHLVACWVIGAATAVAGIASCELLLVAVPAALLMLGVLLWRWRRR